MDIAEQMTNDFNNPLYLFPSACCPQSKAIESAIFWPPPKHGNGVIPEETLELALKWFETRFKLQGFNYKVSKKTN